MVEGPLTIYYTPYQPYQPFPTINSPIRVPGANDEQGMLGQGWYGVW